MTNMTQASLLIEIANGLATLTLNRSEVHNAFDDELIQSITTTLKEIEQRNDVQIVVLTSQGKHFSAGADLNWMKRMATLTEQQNKDDAQQLAELMHTLNHLSKPTLALVNGAAYGGAIGLIACCDIALATQRSQFCLSEVKIGLSPAVISPYVIAAIGYRQARRYFLSAEAFDANQAHQIGLIHDVVADEAQLKNSSQQLIKTLLKNCPQAMAKTKKLIKTVNSGECDQAMRDYTVNLIASIRVSAEGQEGLTSFLEKRMANWVNDYE